MNMECHNFQSQSVKDLQQFLKARGVTFNDQRKADLVDLLGVFHANQIFMCLDPHLN